MVVPIMVLLFLRGKSDEITDNPFVKHRFSKGLLTKKEVPCLPQHGTS